MAYRAFQELNLRSDQMSKLKQKLFSMKKLILFSAFIFCASLTPAHASTDKSFRFIQETPKKEEGKDKDKDKDKKKKHHGEGHEINKRHNKKAK